MMDGLARSAGPETPPHADARRSWIRIGVLAALVATAAAAWRFTSLGDFVAPQRLVELAEPLRGGPAGVALGIVCFTVASLLMVPVTVLIVSCALLYGWTLGSVTALLGSLLTAAIGYAAGAHLARDALRRLMGRRAEALSRSVGRRGFLAVVTLRVVPVAPFAVINLAAGASHIGWRDYASGTLAGMTPGVILLCLAADRAVSALANPGWGTALTAVALVCVLIGGGALARRLLARET
jgi:phospholipase D1/2